MNSAFPPEALLKLRHGNLGICHTRYSTTGISELLNCQPFVVDTLHGRIAVAHNGELVNSRALRTKVSVTLTLPGSYGSSFQTPVCVHVYFNRENDKHAFYVSNGCHETRSDVFFM